MPIIQLVHLTTGETLRVACSRQAEVWEAVCEQVATACKLQFAGWKTDLFSIEEDDEGVEHIRHVDCKERLGFLGRSIRKG